MLTLNHRLKIIGLRRSFACGKLSEFFGKKNKVISSDLLFHLLLFTFLYFFQKNLFIDHIICDLLHITKFSGYTHNIPRSGVIHVLTILNTINYCIQCFLHDTRQLLVQLEMTVGFNFLSTFCPPICFAPRTDSLFRNTCDCTSVCLTTCGKESSEYLKPFLFRPSTGLSGFSLLGSNINHSSHLEGSSKVCGAACLNRTDDLLLTRQLLYRLS